MDFSTYTVRQISYSDTKPYILEIHYAKRMPSISYSFGLFRGDQLVGVVTYGSPASPFLCKGICGEEYKSFVIELNRLVLKDNIKNEASYLIANSLKLLPKPRVVVSYADTREGHIGKVYQACNFMFTGTTKPRTDMAAKDGKHSRHNLGDSYSRVNRSAKHRYVYIHGNKYDKKKFKNLLKYSVKSYEEVDDYSKQSS